MFVWEYSLVKNNNNKKPYTSKPKTKMQKIFYIQNKKMIKTWIPYLVTYD